MSDPAEEPVNLVLFSGTDDKLTAAAVLTAGAAALGRPVHIFLQYWALDAFRADKIEQRHQLAPEAGEAGAAAVEKMRAAGQQPWVETMRQAKEIGEVDIQACSLSMDLLELSADQLDPIVDGVEGVAAFYVNAGAGQIVFI
jgi:peroxiredoxin family protein